MARKLGRTRFAMENPGWLRHASPLKRQSVSASRMSAMAISAPQKHRAWMDRQGLGV
jgi:hypothetical protein